MTLDRYVGCLLGLATGDALGTTLEFTTPGQFEPVTTLTGGGPFALKPGQWTDDTSMALCLAESLVEKGFDPQDQMERYIRWFREGYLSSTGACFDIGIATRQALQKFEKYGQPFSGSTDPLSAGNGSLMRLAPAPMYFANRPDEALQRAGDSSRTTHGAGECVDACQYFAGLIIGALRGKTRQEILSSRFHPFNGQWPTGELSPKVQNIAEGSFKTRHPPQIRGSGYVIDTLEAVLWALHHNTSFEAGALAVVNLGEDADTTGAVFGQIAGALCGAQAIPAHWRRQIAMRDRIEELASQLHARAIT